jgi:branched-chain amino acid aminotransferase
MVYVNGQMIPEAEARISIFDSCVLIGDAVQEVTRTFRHQLFRWPEHRDRLYRSIKSARLSFEMAPVEMDRVTQQFLESNRSTLSEKEECGVGHLVSRGTLGLVLPPTPCSLALYFFPLTTAQKKTAHYYDVGRHVVTPPTRHSHPLTLDPKIKYRSRLHFAIADAEARLVDPEAIPLLLDLEGNLAEGTGWNFFLVRKGELLTPTERNILAGISRQTTIELAKKDGIGVIERDLQPYDALNAEEAFLTATSLCLMPVTRFNGQPIGEGRPGPMTRRLMSRWKEYLNFDFEAQAKQFLQPSIG